MDYERRRQDDRVVQGLVIGKYLASGISAVIISLMIWVGNSVNGQGVALATLIERVANLQDKINNMPVSVTRNQVDERIRPVEKDLERLNEKVNRIERDVYVGKMDK